MYDLGDKRWLTNLNQIKPIGKKVMLTFDDGPGRHLPSILDVLQEKNVKALFFWHSRLLYNERPWKRVVEDGHKIGSHAANHKNLTTLSKERQYMNIKTSVDKLEQTIGQKVHYFRPPFGQYNEETMKIIEALNLTPVMWDITSYDWNHKTNPTCIKTNVIDYLKEGSIILLHELQQTAVVLPELIDEIRNKGFEFDVL
ncbi:polysaccharide deacetylase family protein [Bacillus sp. AK128]